MALLRTNLIANPSSEVAPSFASNLFGATAARSTATATVGTASTVLTGTAATVGASTATGTAGAPVAPGVAYRARFDARGSASNAAGRTIQLRVDWYDAAGASAGTSSMTSLGTVGSSWVTGEATVTPPAGAAFAALRIAISNVVAGEVFYVDAALLETVSTYAGTYFDGDTPDTTTRRYDWTGTAHASTSTLSTRVDVSLIATTDPKPVRIVTESLAAGGTYRVEGVTADRQAWPVPGGVGVTDGPLTLIDNRAALNTPVTYRVTLSDGTVYESDPITVPYSNRHLIQSLDGQTVVDVESWLDNGMPMELVVRRVTFDVPGRARPPARHAPGGDGGGALEIRTSKAGSAALRTILKAGSPVVVRTDGTVRDWPAVELLSIESAPSVLFGAYDAAAPHRMSEGRVWTLGYTLADDPEPATPVTVWDWDDFDAFWAGKSWNDFDAFFAGSDWTTFDTTAWE